MGQSIRQPAVAGMFYPDIPEALARMVQQYMPPVATQSALGMLAPHAGYVYSGAVAGATFAKVDIPSTTLIVGPKHTRLGASTAMVHRGAWSIPGDTVPIHEALADHLCERLPDVTLDTLAHQQEHGIEVMLPFLRARQPNASFVPIVFDHRSLEECRTFGLALGEALQAWPEPVLVLISSDMNHYEDQETTLLKDQLALDAIFQHDPEKLYHTCQQRKISMCGMIPATIALYALLHLGLHQVDLLDHATSADTNGDTSRVVGYAGMVFT